MRRTMQLVLGCVGIASAAPFGFSNTLGDHVVLQNPIVLWGTGTPGLQVTTVITASGTLIAHLNTTVGTDSLWHQPLAAMSEGLTPYTIFAMSGTSNATLDDVLIGKTFMCSGQSNIDLVSVGKALNGTAELSACADWPHVRFLKTASSDIWTGPQRDLGTKHAIPWSVPSDSSCAGVSATCFFVARELFVQLGGTTPVGVVQSAVGGTSIRQWVPTEGLARCSQPWAGLMHYGAGPYAHSTHYNGMIAPFGTGPTAFAFVLWDQAESDSFPQTNPGYYSCQTLAHISSWRALLHTPALPWVLVHLQPYSGSESDATTAELAFGKDVLGSPLAELRHNQLSALALPATGYASAIDLGDPTSPYGDVHFRNKQVIAHRAVSAALSVAFGRKGGSGGALAYPPPSFLTQVPAAAEIGCAMQVRFANLDGDEGITVRLGATPNPALPGNGSNVCYPPLRAKPPYYNATCGGFELLCSTPEVPHNPSHPSMWVAADAEVSADGTRLTLKARAGAAPPGLVARGSRYAWADFPQATLYAATAAGAVGLPVLPWNQALTCSGTNPLPAGAVC